MAVNMLLKKGKNISRIQTVLHFKQCHLINALYIQFSILHNPECNLKKGYACITLYSVLKIVKIAVKV